MKKNKKIIWLLFVVFALGMSSCATTPVCLTASNTPLKQDHGTENMGKVEGLSPMKFSFLELWMFGQPDMQSAINDALSQKKADALINVKCYEINYHFILFRLTRVKVEGEAVRFVNYGGDNVPYK